MHEKLDMKSLRWIQIAQKIDLHLRGSAKVMNRGPLWRAPSLSLLCSAKRMSTIIYHGWNSYTITVGLVDNLRNSALSHRKKKRVQDSSSTVKYVSSVCCYGTVIINLTKNIRIIVIDEAERNVEAVAGFYWLVGF